MQVQVEAVEAALAVVVVVGVITQYASATAVGIPGANRTKWDSSSVATASSTSSTTTSRTITSIQFQLVS